LVELVHQKMFHWLDWLDWLKRRRWGALFTAPTSSRTGRSLRAMPARAAGAQRESSNAAASLLDELFVGGMVTNPKPRSRVSFEETQGPVTQSDPEGPNVGLGLDTFKFERWMEGIFFPDLKSFLGCLPCRIRQLAVGFPE
jgi:hypothetical protein